jgi:hypothetical protein
MKVKNCLSLVVIGILERANDKVTSLTEENEHLKNEMCDLRSHNIQFATSVSGGDLSRPDVQAQLTEKDRQIEELIADKKRLQSQIEQLVNVRLISQRV